MDDEEKTRRIQVCRKERWVKRENVCSFIGPAVGCLTGLRICRHTASTTEWSWLCFVKSSAQARQQFSSVNQTRHITAYNAEKGKRN